MALVKRTALVIGILAAASAVVLAAVLWTNPLRRNDASVHAYLLELVPAGSRPSALHEVARREGWTVKGSWSRGPGSDWGGIDGATVVWVGLGGYWNVFRTDLDSFWAFDERGRLVDVRVRRMTDGL